MEKYQMDGIRGQIRSHIDNITEAEEELHEYITELIERLNRENEKLIGENVDLEHELDELRHKSKLPQVEDIVGLYVYDKKDSES